MVLLEILVEKICKKENENRYGLDLVWIWGPGGERGLGGQVAWNSSVRTWERRVRSSPGVSVPVTESFSRDNTLNIYGD